MKYSILPILAIALVVTTFTIALAQVTPQVEGPNVTAIAKGLISLDFWITLFLALVSGAIGGLVYELLILQGRIERPHKADPEEDSEEPTYAIVKYMYDFGIFARLIIGALAAIAAMLVLSPSTTFSMLATSLVAGSAGTSVFRSMQDRLLTALAQKDAAETKNLALAQADKVSKIGSDLTALKAKLASSTSTVAQPDLDKIEEIDTILKEAKGISDILKRKP